MNSRYSAFVMAACVFALDRLSKIWIDQRLGAWDVWPVIPGLLNIIHSENRGMAFSLLHDAPASIRTLFLVVVSGAVLCFVALMLWRATHRLQRSALLLILGGALGNLYDRLFRGSVTDFVDFYVGDYHWATFNVADSAITIGAMLMAAELWLTRKEQRGAEPESKAVS
ncbi:MAG: signal peptidase II [Bryobacteraceae bacterium]